MSVQRSQRFTRDNPCPVCRGYERAGHGQGKRCYGYRSADGNFAYCTREEWSADAISFCSEASAWVHDLRRAPATERGGYVTRNGVDLRPLSPLPLTEAGTTLYDYRSADDALLFQVVRYPDKRFVQRRPDGKGGWAYNLDGVPRVLYRLPELLASGMEETVYVVEGEKDVHTLRALGLVATCNPGGAGKWREEYNEHLRGRQVVIVPDNDVPGWEHALAVAKAVTSVAGVKVITLPDVAEKGDVTDWLNGSGSLEALAALVEAEDCWVEMAQQLDQGDQGCQGCHLIVDGNLGNLPIEQAKSDDQGDQEDQGCHLQQVGSLGSLGSLASSSAYGPIFVRPATVLATPVQWLWQGYLPLGKLTVLDGDPGLGKSTLMTDIAARLTRGAQMPDGSPGLDAPAGVLMLSAEDDIGATIRPRLDAAGALIDRTLIFQRFIALDGERLPTIADIKALEQGIQAAEARLVIIDPLMAYLPPTANAYRDQDVRRVLAPLGALAERTGAAIVIVRHPNKGVGMSALHRGGGSIGIIGAARVGLLVAPDPNDPDGPRRVLAVVKNNLAPPASALAYHIETAENGVGRIVWDGATSFTANQLVAPPLDGDERSAYREAIDFLRDALAEGPQPATVMLKLAQDAGITERTLKRAKRESRCGSMKTSGGAWVWHLPDAPAA